MPRLTPKPTQLDTIKKVKKKALFSNFFFFFFALQFTQQKGEFEIASFCNIVFIICNEKEGKMQPSSRPPIPSPRTPQAGIPQIAMPQEESNDMEQFHQLLSILEHFQPTVV